MTLTRAPMKMTTSAGVILRSFMAWTVSENTRKVKLNEWFSGAIRERS